jgi:hypothetical protein
MTHGSPLSCEPVLRSLLPPSLVFFLSFKSGATASFQNARATMPSMMKNGRMARNLARGSSTASSKAPDIPHRPCHMTRPAAQQLVFVQVSEQPAIPAIAAPLTLLVLPVFRGVVNLQIPRLTPALSASASLQIVKPLDEAMVAAAVCRAAILDVLVGQFLTLH